MLFNSLTFVLFFVLVYALYRLLPLRGQNLLLLASSYVFYGAWDWRFLSLILFSTIVDYYCGQKIFDSSEARRKKVFLSITLASNLGLLGIFKYYNFFIENFILLLEAVGLGTYHPLVHVILPVGISFYTFQTLSYSIDIYRGKLEPERNFLNFALFVSFFPQLVAGPIERARRLLPQLRRERSIRQIDIVVGSWLVFFGYFLKIFVADNLAPLVNTAYEVSASYDPELVLVGTYAFAFQIFGDFAGYSSIAIGLSRLMGIHLMRNFGLPYFVSNPQDFWRHWHISLSTWLRDYLYISLGGSKNGTLLTYRNLFLTMLLGGIWHGAAWNFVIWGIYQGGILILHRLISRRIPEAISDKRWYKPLTIFVMFHFTCLGWLIFRAESWQQIVGMVASFGDLPDFSNPIFLYQLTVLTVYIAPLVAIQLLQYYRRDYFAVLRLQPSIQAAVLVAMAILILGLGEFGDQQFLYFQF